jgi:hypothetical protein
MAKQKERARTARPTGPVARNDAYTLMLFVTFVAIVTACILLYMDFDEYGQQKAPSASPPAIQKLGTDDKSATGTGAGTTGAGTTPGTTGTKTGTGMGMGDGN